MSPIEQYERSKREWQEANPHASPEEYQDAMKDLAEEAGV